MESCLRRRAGASACFNGQPYPYNNLLEGAIKDATATASSGRCPHEDQPFWFEGECVVPVCANIKQYCLEDSLAGIRARQFCSQTCGCSDPASSLALMGSEFGCPLSCASSPSYAAAVMKLECKDASPGSPKLAAWGQEIVSASKGWPSNWADYAPVHAQAILSYGCSLLAVYRASSGIDWCTFGGTFWPVKPISYLCPESCGCREVLSAGGSMWGCPASCAHPASNSTR